MKRGLVGLAVVLSSCLFFLFCATNNSLFGPGSDDYDHQDLTKVEFVGFVGGNTNFAEVDIFWLVQKLGQGEKPFSAGPTDEEWTYQNCHLLSAKTTDGKYYVYRVTVQTERVWNYSAGLNASKDNFRGAGSQSGWLTPGAQGGSYYFNGAGMSFKAKRNKEIVPGP